MTRRQRYSVRFQTAEGEPDYATEFSFLACGPETAAKIWSLNLRHQSRLRAPRVAQWNQARLNIALVSCPDGRVAKCHRAMDGKGYIFDKWMDEVTA